MDEVKNILGDLRGRIKNPLILSFILVWLYLHWRLVYIFFTIESTLPLQERLNELIKYIEKHNGWQGMILHPLIVSFFSLIVYYLIAIAAQAIKVLVGKRLNAQMLAKVDTGNFALKSDVENEKSRHQRTAQELQDVKNSLVEVTNEKTSLKNRANNLETKLITTQNSLTTIESNILKNEKFVENFEPALLYLLAAMKQISVQGNDPEIHKNYFRILDGNWHVYDGNVFSKNHGGYKILTFEGLNVNKLDGTFYGTINNYAFDKKHNLLEISLKPERIDIEKYYLIKMTDNELIGFCNNLYCHFRRHD